MTVINRPPSSTITSPPVRKPFAAWTLQDAKAAIEWIRDRRVGREGFDANKAYAQDHDHYQNGAGWVGPEGSAAMESKSRVKTAVQRQFTPVDAIAEVLDNLANALLQTRANVALEPIQKPPDDEDEDVERARQEKADQFLSVVNRWAEDRGFLMKAREAVKRSRWATWGTLRVWIPESEVAPTPVSTDQAEQPSRVRQAMAVVGRAITTLVERPTEVEPDQGEQQTTLPLPSGLTLEEALEKVHLSAPSPDQGFVYVDPDTQRRVGLFLYADEKEEFVEMCWLDDAGKTLFRVVSSKGPPAATSLELGQRLTMNQMEAELLITAPVRMQQAQLNFAQSILTRLMETAGFPERYLFDAMPFGELTDTAPSGVPAIKVQTDDSGKDWYLIPKEPVFGAGVLSQVRSLADEDGSGKTTPRTASVTFKEPTDPEYVIKASKHARSTILRQCKQGHLEMDDQATASGWSRVQARATHVADVTNMKDPLIQLVRETLEAALAFAGLMSVEARAVLATYRVVVTVHINIGPVAPEEQTVILERMKAGALSLPTALTLLQVDDVAGEIERIRSQPESQRATLKQQSEVMAVLIRDCQLNQVTAAKLVGLTDEQVGLIQAGAIDLGMPQNVDAQGNPVDDQGNPLPPKPGNGNQPPDQNQPPQRRGVAA